jgi:MFS family permease
MYESGKPTIVERHSPEPMVPLHLFGSRNFSGASIMTFLLYAGFGGAVLAADSPDRGPRLLCYRRDGRARTVRRDHVRHGTLGRRTGDRHGEKLPLMVGPVLAAAGFVLFALPGVGGSYWTTYFPAVVVLGIGMNLVFGPLSIAILNAVESEHSGLGSGVNRSVQ